MLDRLINQQRIHFILYGNTCIPKILFCPIHWLTIPYVMLYSNSMMVLKDEVSLTQGVRKSKIFIRKVLLLLVKLPNYTKSTVKYCDH